MAFSFDSPIIHASELKAIETQVRLLDACADPGARERFLSSHLAGASWVDLENDLATVGDAKRGGRHPLPAIDRWTQTLGALGITPETKVVVYDYQSGALAAARLWWMLRAVGHQKVALLDGGEREWRAHRLTFSHLVHDVKTAPPYPAKTWQLPLADAVEVDRVRGDKHYRVVDVRAPERYRGEVEPFDPVAGHIPDALNIFYKENLQEDGQFRRAETLRLMYQDYLEDVPPEHVIVHCGSGVTACHTLLALEYAGMRGAQLYVGSWSEWCRSSRPLWTKDA